MLHNEEYKIKITCVKQASLHNHWQSITVWPHVNFFQKNYLTQCFLRLASTFAINLKHNLDLLYNLPSPTSRVVTSLMMSLIEVSGERRSHTKFCDNVTATSWGRIVHQTPNPIGYNSPADCNSQGQSYVTMYHQWQHQQLLQNLKNMFSLLCHVNAQVCSWLQSPGNFSLHSIIASNVHTVRWFLSLFYCYSSRRKFFQPQQCFEALQLSTHCITTVLNCTVLVLQCLQIGIDY